MVVLRHETKVFSFSRSPRELLSVGTRMNDEGDSSSIDYPLMDVNFHVEGVCALSASPQRPWLALPGPTAGHVQLIHLYTKQTTILPAHRTALACLALNRDSTLLATASRQGTLIRVFRLPSPDSPAHAQWMAEFRRGSDQARIWCLAFSSDGKWLAVGSDKGTLHLFSLGFANINLKNEQREQRYQQPKNETNVKEIEDEKEKKEEDVDDDKEWTDLLASDTATEKTEKNRQSRCVATFLFFFSFGFN